MACEAEAVWRRIRVVTGLTLIGLGMIGTLVPIIPGVPLFIAGVALAGPDHPTVRRLTDRLRQWGPKKKASSGG